MTPNGDEQTPTERIAELYEQAESAAAQASERLVGSGGFSTLLGQLAENAAALTKLSADALDLTIRNLRLAGRRDVIRLSRQLARTEDKLERVLQEIEALHDRLDSTAARTDAQAANGQATSRQATPRARRQASGPDRPPEPTRKR